ncbi:polysaccharide deacetylase family protein [Roseicyclus sp.]|uniref:polysaccharide deacetylase family protein n=1 Tax=Roseicyclus sp. TaxID=1914329 RepID=UPI003F6ABC2E
MPNNENKTRRAVLQGAMGFGATALWPRLAFGQDLQRPALRQRPFHVAENGEFVDQIGRIRTNERVLALTFDDGPHAIRTPRVLDILASRRVKASFFVIGNRVVQAPGLVARIAREGHEIGNHSWSHPHMSQMSDSAILDQIDRAALAVAAATGFSPVLMRPPYGEFDLRQSRMVRLARGLPTILWSVDPQDWRRPGGLDISDHIIANADPGAVILSHDIVEETVRNLPRILDVLMAQGYRFVTVSELLGWPLWTEQRMTEATPLG